jgi:alginate O-acetyltransferase complex protein AlgI
MLFNSIEFVIFFPLVTILYFILPHKYRWALLLLASCYFYMAFVPVYIVILGFTIVVDYFAGLQIAKQQGKKRKLFLIISLIANIGVLGIFKYYNFINENLSFLTDLFGFKNSLPFLKILLPIGLSFHTFQAMSYTIEVYRGHQKPERHFGIYSLYVMFYPQLVAGPIERPQNLLQQFREKHSFDYRRVADGLKLMAWGMFKKVVVADRIAQFVNAVFDDPNNYSVTSMLMATLFFAIQIYCDFSGYSDIALGSAQVMGFSLMRNFRKPYGSKSVSEFWTRWHISLSTWFKDYVYIPLGGNRVVKWRQYYNLLIVFLLSGIWHGANWTFVVWGLLHACFLIAGLITLSLQQTLSNWAVKSKLGNLNAFLHVAVTFILVDLAWIFFRARSLNDSLIILKGTLRAMLNFNYHDLLIDIDRSGLSSRYLMISVPLILLIIVSQNLKIDSFVQWTQKLNVRYRWAVYYLIILSIIIFGVYQQSQFIYFQF